MSRGIPGQGQGLPVVEPERPSFGQRFENVFSTLGGLDVGGLQVGQDFTEEERNLARNRGLQQFLYALSAGARGEDPLAAGLEVRRMQEQQRLAKEQKKLQEELFKDPKYKNIATILGPQFAFQQREAEEKRRKEEQMNLELQEAIASGDTDKALSIAAGLNRGSVIQAIQAKERAEQPYLIGEGDFTVTPKDGKLEVTTNEEVIEAKRKIEEEERDAVPKLLPASLLKVEDEDYIAAKDHENIKRDVDKFLKAIDEGKLEAGFGEEIQSYFGNLGLTELNEQSREKIGNYNDLKRFVTRYVNSILRLNKGPQTEGDALRALDELKASRNIEDVKRVLENLRNISDREITFRKSSINRRRKSYGAEVVDFDTPTWKIVEEPLAINEESSTSAFK